MLIKISWRNIWRNKKRSLIIIGAVIIGLWSGIFVMGFYNGMIEQRINTAITREISHLQLHQPSFLEDYDINDVLPDGMNLMKKISGEPGVKAAAGRIILRGMIASANGTSGITINAVIPAIEQKVTGLEDKVTAGNYFPRDKSNQIILSEKTLHKLKVKLSNKVILTFQDKEGDLASAAFRVCATYKTINTPYDEGNVFVNITDVDSLAGIKGAINEIAVLLKSSDLMEGMQEKFTRDFPDVATKNWMEISPELGLTVSATDQMVFIFMGIILLALAFGIVNTMLMAILERTREIGMLLALGMNKWKVFQMILFETFFLILAGCPVGIFLALMTVVITHRTGINLHSYGEAYADFGYDPLIYPSLTGEQFGIIMLLVVITAILSAIFPAQRALRLKPAESIKK